MKFLPTYKTTYYRLFREDELTKRCSGWHEPEKTFRFGIFSAGIVAIPLLCARASKWAILFY